MQCPKLAERPCLGSGTVVRRAGPLGVGNCVWAVETIFGLETALGQGGCFNLFDVEARKA